MERTGKSETINYDELYYKEMSKFPVLSYDETRELFIQYEQATGEDKILIRNKIINHNLRLVAYVAKKYVGRGVDQKDLLQEGTLGLMMAIDKFDYRKGNSFAPFAIYKIQCTIKDYIFKNFSSIRRSKHLNEKLINYLNIKDKVSNRIGRGATIEEVAEELGVSPEKIYEYEKHLQHPIYLDHALKQDKYTRKKTYLDYLCEEKDDFEELFDRLVIDDLEYTLHNCGLNEKEVEIIKTRYGFYSNDEPIKLEDVGEMFGVSRETIRNVERKAIKKLREALISPRNKKDFCLDEPKPFGKMK